MTQIDCPKCGAKINLYLDRTTFGISIDEQLKCLDQKRERIFACPNAGEAATRALMSIRQRKPEW